MRITSGCGPVWNKLAEKRRGEEDKSKSEILTLTASFKGIMGDFNTCRKGTTKLHASTSLKLRSN